VAVEPTAEMRGILRDAVPEVEAVDATAEELPFEDGSVDAITVAAALHWFDVPRALDEFARVLSPGGGLAIAWNRRDPSVPIHRELDELIVRSSAAPSRLRGFDVYRYFPHGAFGPLEQAEFAHEQRFDPDGLVERMLSISFVALLPDDEREELLARVRAVGERHGSSIAFPYRTEVFVSRRA
jgi:SAM-dependent methyltransferase